MLIFQPYILRTVGNDCLLTLFFVSGWDQQDQWAFKSYMGSVWQAWKNTTESTSIKLFNGSPTSTDLLARVIKDGKMITGSNEGNTPIKHMSIVKMRNLMEKSFYSYVIPILWQKAGINVFVMDTGRSCNPSTKPSDWENPVPSQVYNDDMAVAGAYFQNKLYFLMYPEGASDGCQIATGSTMCGVTYKFTVPPGLDTMGQRLGGQEVVAWGGLLPIDIIGR